MIDLKDLRENPDKYKRGAANKNSSADIDQLLILDQKLRKLLTENQQLTAEKNKIGKQIGQIAGKLKKAEDSQKLDLQKQMQSLQQRPSQIKQEQAKIENQIPDLQKQRDQIWLTVPQPADEDVPVGKSEEDNVEISVWHPDWFDPKKSFEQNRGFKPKTHIQLGESLGLFDTQRGVKMAGTRSYVLTGDGMRLHNAILQWAFDYMTQKQGFKPMSVPVLVRRPLMVGTGFFPTGEEQAYEVDSSRLNKTDGEDENNSAKNGSAKDDNKLFLTGTGEVGLMGLHQDEILDIDTLPRCYTTLSTCFRREAGSAGKDTAGLYRIHQFDKVEQVVICKADSELSRKWHKKMLGFVETLLQTLELPYRLLQCCTGDLGLKNADMIDVEAWMPSRGAVDSQGFAMGGWGETHSASRLYDYQCRRLNLRYKDNKTKETKFCHSLNNTVAASPRILIPIIEMYQNEDGSVNVPEPLWEYMGNKKVITKQ